MRRREFIGFVGGAAAWPLAARAQQASRIARIGVLVPGGFAVKPVAEAFREGLRDLGWVEGKNVLIEERFGEGERLPALAAELVNLNVDIIVTGGDGVFAARRVTAAVPIVMGAFGDAVALGLAASFTLRAAISRDRPSPLRSCWRSDWSCLKRSFLRLRAQACSCFAISHRTASFWMSWFPPPRS